MGLFKRLNDVIRSNINSVLDKAEDPVKLANQYLADMEKDISDAERELANVIAQERILANKLSIKKTDVEKREKQIIDVLDKDDNLAKELIASKQEIQSSLHALTDQHLNIKETVEKLKPAITEMHREYDSLRQRRDVLVAQASSAKAEQKVYDALGGIGASGAAMKNNFDRLEEKVQTQTARAQASRELVSERSGNSLDQRVNSVVSSTVDQEFEKLKAERANANV